MQKIKETLKLIILAGIIIIGPELYIIKKISQDDFNFQALTNLVLVYLGILGLIYICSKLARYKEKYAIYGLVIKWSMYLVSGVSSYLLATLPNHNNPEYMIILSIFTLLFIDLIDVGFEIYDKKKNK